MCLTYDKSQNRGIVCSITPKAKLVNVDFKQLFQDYMKNVADEIILATSLGFVKLYCNKSGTNYATVIPYDTVTSSRVKCKVLILGCDEASLIVVAEAIADMMEGF